MKHAKPYYFPSSTPSLTIFHEARQALLFSMKHAKPYYFPSSTPSLTIFLQARPDAK
jgi:hypothetical protein